MGPEAAGIEGRRPVLRPAVRPPREFVGAATATNTNQGQRKAARDEATRRGIEKNGKGKESPASAAGTRRGADEGASGGKSKSATREKKGEEAGREGREAARAARHGRAAPLRSRQKLPLPQDQASIGRLRTAHTRLQEADRDYDGNRVRAMHSARAAIQHLESSAPTGVIEGASLGGLPQAQSDEMLRDSLLKPRNVPSQLGGPRHNARASVTEAIHHIELALRIR